MNESAYGEPVAPDDAEVSSHGQREEHDARMESRYRFDRAALGCAGMSLLATVSVNAEQLTAEFFAWWSASPEPRKKCEVAMIEWERARFGDQLFYAAHGMLWFHIRRRLVSRKRAAEAGA